MSRHALLSSLAVTALLGAVVATAPAASASTTAAYADTLDPTYTPTITYQGGGPEVTHLAAAKDGSAYVSGGFTDVDGQSRDGVAHILADGSLDPTFNVGTGFDNDDVDSLAVQPDGKVVVGGLFSTYDGQPVNHVVRLNTDGTLDSTFNPPVLVGRANGLGIEPDGKILVGLSDGPPVRLNTDGTLDDSFNVTMTPQTGVNNFAFLPNGDIYIAGAWDYLNGDEWRFGLARLNSDGSTDLHFDPRTQVSSGFMFGLHLGPKGTVYAGGKIVLAGGGGTSYLATFNRKGQIQNGIGTVAAPSSYVLSIAVHKGKLILGGYFTAVGGQARGGVAILNKDGSLNDDTFAGGVSGGQVWAVDAGSKGSVLVGGTFSSVNGFARTGLARFIKAS